MQQAIKDRLNYTSSTTDTRLGNTINRIYRQVGTEIGINFARQTNATKVVTIASATVVFSGIERIDRVWYLDSNSKPHILDQVLIDELRNEAAVSSDQPTLWALLSTTSNTVSIRLDANPETAYTLYCDGVAEVADLSGSNEPAFPESFHDILVEGVLREEYLKLEKPSLADRAEAAYEKRLSGLRMFMAKTGYMDIYQGKKGDSSSTRSSGGGVAAQAVTGPTSSTDNAVARFNGTGGTVIQNSSVIIDDSDGITMASTGSITLPNSGLHVFDTNASHDLIITPGSNLTADRILTITTGDAARTVTISGDSTISQDYSTSGSPQFTGLTITGDGTVTGTLTFDADGLHIFDTNASHDLIITPGSDLSADRVLTITTGDSARTVTISGNATISQDYSTAGSPQFTGIELGHATDTTLTRVSAGLVAIEGVNVVTTSATQTLTAKTLTDVTLDGTSVNVGGGASATEVRLLEPSGGGSSYTGFKAPALAGNVMYTMPTADGTSGQLLSTNGSATLSWAGATAGLNTMEGRLTLTTAVPITTADVTAATTIYWTPFKGNRVTLYDGSSTWTTDTTAEISLAVPATTDTMYDMFMYDNSGTPTLEATAWTNDTTRATALTLQDGVLVKTGATTRRYLGSFRTTGVSGQTEDSLVKRYLWNFYHQEDRALRRLETTASWSYTSTTIRQANGSTSNQVDVVVGYAGVLLNLRLIAGSSSTSANVGRRARIGEDSTTAMLSGQASFHISDTIAFAADLMDYSISFLHHYPAVGRHYYTWNETGNTGVTWYGTSSNNSSGLSGSIRG